MAHPALTDKDFVAYPAPEFRFDPATGKGVGLESIRGKWAVIYFYPKDDTPSCTNEAQDFSALLPEFEAAGAVVVGISKDSEKSHTKFRTKYDLKHQLVSDESGAVVEDWGVWGEKKLYGRVYMGIERATFLIDPQGLVRHVWRQVRVKGHAQDVLTLLGTLAGADS